MSRIKRARPSPALVISIVAMFAALGGGAFAATATTSKQAINKKGNLNKNVVKKKNIAKNAVVTSKIKEGKVTGSKLSDESVNASKLGLITEVTSAPTTVSDTPPGIGSATATCPEGTKVIGGGFNTNTVGLPTNAGVAIENRRTDNGWRAGIFAQGAPVELTVSAYCLDGNG